MQAAFTAAVNQFSSNPAVNGRALRDLLNTDPEEFFRSAVPVLKCLQEEPGPTYVLVLLLSHGLLISDLLQDNLFTPEELVTIARQLSKVDPQFGVKLLKSVLPDGPKSGLAKPATVDMRLRLMDIVESVSDGQRILPLMKRLMRDPEARVRSKAALLVGRITHNARWVEECLGEGDSRVRANAVESLWDVDSEGLRTLLWNTLSDPDNRVLGNALLGLYRLGEAAVVEHILLMAADPRDLYRATAAWVMGRTGDARFQPTLVHLIRDSAVLVRANAFRALRSINQTKSRLARTPVLRLSGWRNPSTENHDPMHRDEIQIAAATELDLGDSQTSPISLLSGLQPTDFVLHRDSTLIANYEVSEVNRTGPLSLAFLVPRAASDDPLHDSFIRALDAATVCRRGTDRWMIARYRTASAKRLPFSLLEKTIRGSNGPLHLATQEVPAEPETLAPPPDPVFLTDSQKIEEVLQTGWAENLPDPAQCLQAAVRIAQNSKSPHFLLLVPLNSSIFSLEFLTEAGRAASALKATFHAIAIHPGAVFDPGIQSLCQKSGGICLRTHAAQLPQLLADLSARLISSYRIRFAAGPGSIKVQIVSDRGCGSLSID